MSSYGTRSSVWSANSAARRVQRHAEPARCWPGLLMERRRWGASRSAPLPLWAGRRTLANEDGQAQALDSQPVAAEAGRRTLDSKG